jgi:hypothetical protein
VKSRIRCSCHAAITGVHGYGCAMRGRRSAKSAAEKAPSFIDAFLAIGGFCKCRPGCPSWRLEVCACGLLKAQNDLIAAFYSQSSTDTKGDQR